MPDPLLIEDYSLEGDDDTVATRSRADSFGFWARLTTASPTVPSRYGWVVVTPDPGGASWVDDADAISAGPDDPGAALEANGATGLAAGDVVWLVPGPLGQGEGFAFRAAGAAGPPGTGSTVAMATVNPGSGDTGVSLSGVTTIQIDQASGLNLAAPGKILAQPASVVHAGAVTTAAQSFAGPKTFVDPPVTAGNTSLTSATAFQGQSALSLAQVTVADSGHAGGLFAGDSGYSALMARETISGVGHLTYLALPPALGYAALSSDIADPCFAVFQHGPGLQVGQYRTVAGLVFSGGLLTGGTYSGVADHKVLVDAADLVPEFLAAKLTAGTGITLTITPGGGGEEHIVIASTGGGGLPETPLAVAHGGTGQTTLTAHAVLLGEGTTALGLAVPSTPDYVLTSNGAGSDPSFKPAVGDHKVALNVSDLAPDYLSAKLAAGANITLTPSAGMLVIATSGAGINDPTNGGSGAYVLAASFSTTSNTYVDVTDSGNAGAPVQVTLPSPAGVYLVIARVRMASAAGPNVASAQLVNVGTGAIAGTETAVFEAIAGTAQGGGTATIYAWVTSTGSSLTIRLQAKSSSAGSVSVRSDANGRTRMDYGLWK